MASDTNPLLGFVSEDKPSSKEEDDLKSRSSKKVKGGEQGFTGATTGPVSYADVADHGGMEDSPKPSFKEIVMGGQVGDEDESLDSEEESDDAMEGSGDSEDNSDDFYSDGEDDSIVGIEVVEKKRGAYDCPSLVLSDREQRRIHKPWKKGVFVKLLGRKIGFKALETRLRQMWVKRGVLNLIDLGNEWFLVTFSSRDDQKFALPEGPWLVYDHYLIVREWTPDFQPDKASIEKVAVWVHFSGLPIEYYDYSVLKAIGNRIGHTVRVDINTLKQERGKYARLCVEVDLTKPLLAMFDIKDRVFKIEYEGLHLLCLTCGRFGHYMEGCPHKVAARNLGGEGGDRITVDTRSEKGEASKEGPSEAGPWTIVQKPQRPRRTIGVGTGSAPAVERGIQGPNVSGSRFQILNKDSNSNGEGISENQGESQQAIQSDMYAPKTTMLLPKDKQIQKGKKVIQSVPMDEIREIARLLSEENHRMSTLGQQKSTGVSDNKKGSRHGKGSANMQSRETSSDKEKHMGPTNVPLLETVVIPPKQHVLAYDRERTMKLSEGRSPRVPHAASQEGGVVQHPTRPPEFGLAAQPGSVKLNPTSSPLTATSSPIPAGGVAATRKVVGGGQNDEDMEIVVETVEAIPLGAADCSMALD